ncbi:hypothetical protein BP6252_06578 [Coleophoma cylindrospora]|uniref:Heterokaryon incompatibility domain-containing protein n=1 Tax=Coleophoma cylindrospora TaxID=1849047 RepID=A0A3D8RNB0_9HELO|nr:hypothetical protein BP6252_06578 [Coleophoma cylindrospora]
MMRDVTAGNPPNPDVGHNTLDYTDLKSKDSIRILRLQPTHSTRAELCASFSEARLEEIPPYEAISYTWGAEVFPETLKFPGGCLKITESLASALKAFRYTDRDRIIWADAVCINQKNDVEKGHQVAMMNEIYKRADRVLVWLGDGNESTAYSIQGYQILADELKTSTFSMKRANPQVAAWLKSDERRDSTTSMQRVIGSADEKLQEDHEAILDGSELEPRLPALSQNSGVSDMIMSHGMNLIYERPWFTRLWTVQEVALASEVILCCGKDELDWTSFATVMSLLKSVLSRNGFDMRSSQAFLQAVSVVEARALFQLLASAHSPRFRDIVETIRGQSCTNDRDRIYALLNLQSPSTRLHIEPDYSKSVPHVYIDYALKSLEQGNFENLYDAGMWYRDDNDAPIITMDANRFLPSWVPDFRKPNNRRRLPWLNHASYFQKSIYGDSTLTTVPKLNTAMTISIAGFAMDKISEGRAQSLPLQTVFTAGHKDTFTKTCEHVKACLEIFHQNSGPKYPTGETLENAFWSTITMGGITQTILDLIKGYIPTPELGPKLAGYFEKHCLDPHGEVARRPLVDLWLDNPEFSSSARELSTEAKLGARYYQAIRETMDGIVFFFTQRGLIGLAPPGTRKGDLIAIINGAAYPFVVRAVPGAHFFLLVGPCYTHGIMQGMKYEGEDIETITLI